jgi:hypothetical protein
MSDKNPKRALLNKMRPFLVLVGLIVFVFFGIHTCLTGCDMCWPRVYSLRVCACFAGWLPAVHGQQVRGRGFHELARHVTRIA